MINFFRYIRRQLLSHPHEGNDSVKKNNRFSKYLFYGIGEIVLVMIGILLALQVNNWNEEKKEEATVNRLFNEVLEEIKLNVQECERVLKYEKTRDSIIDLILNDKLEVVDYKSNTTLGSTIIRYFDLDTKETAFQNLSRRSDLVQEGSLGFLSDLEFLYNDPVQDLKKWNILLGENALEVEKNWANKYLWYATVWNEKYSEEATDYFLNDPLYINEVMYYYSLFQMQRISAEKFMKYGLEIYREIYKKHYLKNNLPKWIDEIQSIPITEVD